MSISDEAVEAAARKMFSRWDDLPEPSKQHLWPDVRAILEAAAPYMQDRERIADLIAEYGNELVGSSGGPEHLEYTYADAILGVAE